MSDTKDPRGSGGFNLSNLGRWPYIWLLIIGCILVIQLLSNITATDPGRYVEYSRFKDLVESGQIVRVEITDDTYLGLGTGSGGDEYAPLFRTTPVDDPGFISLLDQANVEYYAVQTPDTSWLSAILSWVLPIGLILLLFRGTMRRVGGMNSDLMSIGRSNSRWVAEGTTGVMFSDVAGADESKAELEEVVDFLKRPERYQEIGGRIPKGVLLVGPPGTGKTLLARAVAGEAGVPFFRLSGADFVEMFVGVGASRVRDLFKKAREKAPSIVFIDELDAIGKSRAASVSTNDEREQTLNQLLVEMDGFDAREGVIIIAATNRPEILDPALLRPGRFDRQVLVDKPDLKGREAILRIHSRSVKLDPEVDLNRVARGTAGLAGADLANIVNEAALTAVRGGRTRVSQEDFSEAIEKTMAGLSKKNRVLNDDERKIVAYHEVGHALAAKLSDGADPVEKISIVPRGLAALGYTLQLPQEDRFLLRERELLGRIDVLLGGRAAEELVFGEVSTGAANDLTRASEIARKMVTDYGMSERYRNVYLNTRREPGFLANGSIGGRDYSEETQAYIDGEVARVIRQRYEYVRDVLEKNRPTLEELTRVLLKQEIIDRAQFEEICAKAA